MNYKNIFSIRFLLKVSVFLWASSNLLAQPSLDVFPKEIRFHNEFERYAKLSFFNNSNSIIHIDSVRYAFNRYFIRFNKDSEIAPQIMPHDNVEMDLVLCSSAQVPQGGAQDSIMVYSNGNPSVLKISVSCDFFRPDSSWGMIKGTIDLPPPQHSSIYFFYKGRYIIDSAFAGQMGKFSRSLPVGDYLVAAISDSTYLTFYPNTTNIAEAQMIHLGRDLAVPIYIKPIPIIKSSYSFNGTVLDSASGLPSKKGIVIVKTGTHTPVTTSKISVADSITTFTYLISGDGYYYAQALPKQGYYFAQAFSEYFLPSYYNKLSSPALFWQQADSVNILNPTDNINITVVRDSAYGAGVISGSVANYKTIVGGPVSDAVVFAKSKFNNHVYVAGRSNSAGEFTVNDIPYGTYSLLIQRFGYPDVDSQIFTIDSMNTVFANVKILFPSLINDAVQDKNYLLLSNYPNPFNASTVISYSVPQNSMVEVTVYSSIGEKITELFKGNQSAGTHKLFFNASNLASGVYFIKLTSATQQKIIKAISLK